MRKLLLLFAVLACSWSVCAQTPNCGIADDGKIHGSFNPQQKVTMTSASTTSAVATIVLASSPGGATLPWTVTVGQSLVFEGSSNSALNSFIGTVATITDQQHFTVTFTGQPNGTSTGGFVAPDDWNNKAVPASAGGSYLDGLGSLPGGLGPCTVYRLTADEDSFHDYSTVSPASENGTYILVHGGTNGDRFIGGCPGTNCGVVIVNNATMTTSGTTGCQRSGDDWYDHDPTQDNRYYYVNGKSLMSCVIGTGTNNVTSAVVHTFSEYLNWVAIPDETDILPDGCTMPLVGQNPSSGGVSTFDIFTYNLCTNTKSHLYTTTVNGCANNPPTSTSSGQIGPSGCIHKIIEMADGTPVVQFEGAINNGDPAILATGCNQTGTPHVTSCNLSIDSSGNLKWRQGNYTQCTSVSGGPGFGCSSHFDRSENQAGTVDYIVEVNEPPGFGNQPADPCFKQNGVDVKDYTTASNSTVGTVNCLAAMANIGHISSHFVSATMPYVGASIDPWQAGYFTSSANYRMPNTNCSIPFQTGNNYGTTNSCWFLYQDEAFLISIGAVGGTTTPGVTSGSLYRMFWNYSDSTDTSPPSSGFYSQSKESLSQDGQHIIFTSTMACPNGFTNTNGCNTGNTLTDVYEVSYSLSGPIVSLSPTSLSFGNQNVSTTSAQQVVTLTNTGSATLTISSVALTTGTQFAFATPGSGSDCRTVGTVAASGTCNIAVTFTPTTLGSLSDTVSITDNASGSPHTFSVSGTGIGSGAAGSVLTGGVIITGGVAIH